MNNQNSYPVTHHRKRRNTSKEKATKYFTPYEFTKCENCGSGGAFYRFWAKKRLCSDCAANSIKRYIRNLGVIVVVIALLLIF